MNPIVKMAPRVSRTQIALMMAQKQIRIRLHGRLLDALDLSLYAEAA